MKCCLSWTRADRCLQQLFFRKEPRTRYHEGKIRYQKGVLYYKDEDGNEISYDENAD